MTVKAILGQHIQYIQVHITSHGIFSDLLYSIIVLRNKTVSSELLLIICQSHKIPLGFYKLDKMQTYGFRVL